MKEAAKLGFNRAICATKIGKSDKNDNNALPIIAIKTLLDLIRRVETVANSGAKTDSAVDQVWAA